MRAAVIGAGSFGTSIAQVISKKANEVKIFGRNENVIHSINTDHVNNIYHPLVDLNSNITACNISKSYISLDESKLIIFCVPSGAVRDVANKYHEFLSDKIIISAAKGIEYPSLKYMTQIIKEESGSDSVISLSGPTFADELIRNVLSGITFGVNGSKNERDILDLFRSPNILIDVSTNVEGVELCGILKNIYAVATGIFDSFFHGFNEHYTFLNLCFKEMKYILDEMGNYNMSDKFCAFGDLNLTANSDKSRNRTLGLILGKNIELDPNRSTITLESLKSAKAIKVKTDELNLNVPIINFVDSSFNDPRNMREKVNSLLKKICEYN